MLETFNLHRPTTTDEAVALVAEFGEDAAILAGGTELLLAMKSGLVQPEHVIDISRTGMSFVEFDSANGLVRIGATATHRELASDSTVARYCSALAETEAALANIRVRSQGTLGGNLCFAEPHADPGTILLVYDGYARLLGPRGEREVGLNEFFKGALETCRSADELLTEIDLPIPQGPVVTVYRRFCPFERPTCGVCVQLSVDSKWSTVVDARIAVGAVGPRPELVDCNEGLRGMAIGGSEVSVRVEEVAEAVANECTISPDPDDPADDYARHMVVVLTRRALEAAHRKSIEGIKNG